MPEDRSSGRGAVASEAGVPDVAGMQDVRTDSELVHRVRSGDRRALAELVARYSEKAYRAAYAILGNREDAEDVAQESFLRALERIGSLREPGAFGGWYLRIVSTVSLNARAARKIRTHGEITESIASSEASPAEQAERGSLRERFAEGLASLPEAMRSSVLLCFVEGWNAKEAAGILGIPHATVRSHLHRARQVLRRQFERERGVAAVHEKGLDDVP